MKHEPSMPQECQEFVKEPNDDRYFQWLASHQRRGLVMNRMAKPSEAYLNVHKASCRSIQSWRDSQSGYTHTTRGYGKVCAESMGALQRWVRKAGIEPRLTRRCHCWEDSN